MGRLGKVLLLVCAAILLAPALAAADGPPEITAAWVTGVSPTGATLRAEINPNGLKTSYRFEYITDAAFLDNLKAGREGFFGAAQAPPGKEAGISGTVPKEVTQSVGSLARNSEYHYRPIATNAAAPLGVSGPEHLFTTEGNGEVFSLPDNRAWEMVSPVDKNGGAVAAPEAIFGGGDIQAAAIAPGEGAPTLAYGSATSFGEAAGAPPASQYTARRTASGWLSSNISTPLDSAAYGDDPDGAPYRLFSADLSRALLFGGLACRGGLPGCPAPNPVLPGTGAPQGYMAYYLRDNGSGALSSLLDAADVAHSAVLPQAFEVSFAAANSDLSRILLSSCAALTADATEVAGGPGACDPEEPNLYAWSASGLTAVNGDTPGAEVAAPNGAVSADGSRIYWTRGGNLYLGEGAQTVWVDEAQGGGGTFQTATPDGSVAFFTKGGDLYRFDAATKTALDVVSGAGVVGVLGASADGNYVYYQDASGLRLWHDGAITTVAEGAEAAAASDYPPATGTARVTADGLHLAFLSKAELTGYDNTDAGPTKLPDAQLYVYSPLADKPLCVSCNPTGERPEGPSSIPGAMANGSTRAYKPRALSSDGTRLFFDSLDGLVAADSTKHLPSVYQWEASGTGNCARPTGCVSLISSGGGREGARFLDATANGSDVFFVTGESLVKVDPEGSVDVYDARVDGGLPNPPEPPECIGDSCQPLPGEPDDPTPGTLVPNSGNPRPRIFGPKAKTKRLKLHKHRRHHPRAGGGRRSGSRAGSASR